MGSQTSSDIRTQELNEVVERNRGRLLSVVRRMMRDNAEAEDVLHEVFEEFIESYDLGEMVETASAWLTTVTKNKVLDRFRRGKTREEHRLLVKASGDGDSVDPANEWLRERFREEFATALGLLPFEQREVFVKHELEGLSFEEIARETGANLNTLLSRKRYAVLSLREYLKEIYDELE